MILRTRDERKIPMTKSAKVFNCLGGPRCITNPDVSDIRLNQSKAQEYHRNMAFLELSGDGGGHRNGHHSHTPHHVFNHHPHDSLSSLRVVISGAKQEVDHLLYGLGFEALDEFRKEGIFNIGDDQTEEVAMASRQAACMRVLIVLQVLNYLEDALFCLRGHVASP